MFDPRILLLGPGLNDVESAASLERLHRVILPNATKYVVAPGKFDTQKWAKTFNAEAGAEYPADAPYLHTLAAWAEVRDWQDPRFRDGYDFFCLRSILSREESFDYAILLREPVLVQGRWRDLRVSADGKLFLTFSEEPTGSASPAAQNVLFNLADPRTPAFLELLWDLFVTGVAYAMAPYSFEEALNAAADALRLEDEISMPRCRADFVSANVV